MSKMLPLLLLPLLAVLVAGQSPRCCGDVGGVQQPPTYACSGPNGLAAYYNFDSGCVCCLDGLLLVAGPDTLTPPDEDATGNFFFDGGTGAFGGPSAVYQGLTIFESESNPTPPPQYRAKFADGILGSDRSGPTNCNQFCFQPNYNGPSVTGATRTCTFPTSFIKGDPHFVLFGNKHMEFQGIPGAHFNLITEHDHLINARFDRLADEDSTFVTAVGFSHGSLGRVLVAPSISGHGLDVVFNNESVSVGAKREFRQANKKLDIESLVSGNGASKVVIKTELLRFAITREAKAQHLDISVAVNEIVPMHGILGRSLHGAVDGDELSFMTSGLFASDTPFNMYVGS